MFITTNTTSKEYFQKKNIKDIIEFKLVKNQIQARIFSLKLFDKFLSILSMDNMFQFTAYRRGVALEQIGLNHHLNNFNSFVNEEN